MKKQKRETVDKVSAMNEKGKRRKWLRLFLLFAFLLYLALLIQMIVFKVHGDLARAILANWSWENVGFHARSANWIPFREMFVFHNSFNVKVLFYNIIAFGPFGFLFPLLIQKRKSLLPTILAGAGFSLLLELAQLITIFGQFDINDIILNTFGTFLGWCAFILMKYLIDKIIRHKQSEIRHTDNPSEKSEVGEGH